VLEPKAGTEGVGLDSVEPAVKPVKGLAPKPGVGAPKAGALAAKPGVGGGAPKGVGLPPAGKAKGAGPAAVED